MGRDSCGSSLWREGRYRIDRGNRPGPEGSNRARLSAFIGHRHEKGWGKSGVIRVMVWESRPLQLIFLNYFIFIIIRKITNYFELNLVNLNLGEFYIVNL